MSKYLAAAAAGGINDHHNPEDFMIIDALNWLLDLWGSVFAGSSGYEIPPGSLPFGSS
ncbi:hypothetical protein [Nocardia sp. NPDC024068]|uniref:hypothetical protein n=1 Tax=Nocardia sp. NPDC024068 TaxID=3157197 RepID=UPI0033ED5B7B